MIELESLPGMGVNDETLSRIGAFASYMVAHSSTQSTLWNMENRTRGVGATWNYIDGCMLHALLTLDALTAPDAQYAPWRSPYGVFVEQFLDHFVQPDGSITSYEPQKQTLDDINEGRALFPVYAKTGQEKYTLAISRLHEALQSQPRTQEGSFWHKAIYPNQVWLDGIYMAQPFQALYEKTFGSGDYADILQQLHLVREHMFDERARLYYHGYDASRQAFWADPVTGLSRSFWLRAIGWFAIALADLAEIVPTGPLHDYAGALLSELVEGIAPYADPATGLYYQVVDKGALPGNYLESSGSAMLVYAMLKGHRLGLVSKEYAHLAERGFAGLCRTQLHLTDQELSLGGICLSAGLGPENSRRRDGTFAYYISEPVVRNDAKGTAPFLLCYTEIHRRYAHGLSDTPSN